MIVEAATVDCAYIDGAYTDVPFGSVFSVVTERLEEWPRKGMLGRRGMPCFLSRLTDTLLREDPSKWPDLFSRKDAWTAKPESFRETGVGGNGGKKLEVGDILGEGG